MPMPKQIGVIETMIGIPSPDQPRSYDFMRPLFRDRESIEQFAFPVEYMFKDVPKQVSRSELQASEDHQAGTHEDYIKYTLEQMDRFGIEKAVIGVSLDNEVTLRAVKQHRDRFIPQGQANPNQAMDGVRRIVREYEELGISSLGAFPCGLVPQVPINDKQFYPIYAKCVELDIAIFCCAGVPGPRIPMYPQLVQHVDEVCWYFPELKFVFRHGCEPWEDLAVKLMLKWPNLYYSTSAFAPRHYPKAIIDYANTRGADKVIYAGYWPMGLSLERIFSELPSVPFKDEVWPKFLRQNALRVLNEKG